MKRGFVKTVNNILKVKKNLLYTAEIIIYRSISGTQSILIQWRSIMPKEIDEKKEKDKPSKN